MATKPSDSAFKVLISKIMIFLILLLAIYMQNTAVEAAKKSDADPPGSLMIEMFWPDDSCSDVDLWTEGPSGGPVGYSRRSGKTLNLLRDDLGCNNDTSGRNFENVYSRGSEAGEFIVNVHGYSGSFPLNVDVIVSTKDPHSALGAFQQIIKRSVTIETKGEEVTVVRFKLDKDGNLVPGSINWVPKKVRNS